MGFVITGCANLMILGEIPSYPVAFLMFNLFICLVTKSSFIGLKNNLSLFVLFVSILFILGWVFIYFDVLISYIFGYIHKKVVKHFSHLLWIIYNLIIFT